MQRGNLPRRIIAARMSHVPASPEANEVRLGKNTLCHGLIALALVTAGTTSCYHFAFEQQPEAPVMRTVTYVDHPATFINGFVGTGRVDARAYCEHPIRTELYVGPSDVLFGVLTLLVYTPHTLEVVCPAPSYGQSADSGSAVGSRPDTHR